MVWLLACPAAQHALCDMGPIIVSGKLAHQHIRKSAACRAKKSQGNLIITDTAGRWEGRCGVRLRAGTGVAGASGAASRTLNST